MTQAQAVIETIEKLGGIATLTQINQKIFEIKDCNWGTKTPFASIRRIVRHTKGIYPIKKGLALGSSTSRPSSTATAAYLT